ncbi:MULTISPECIES: hypothetical protein [Streptomycetaceae]|uniref:Uncharacterized protein n=1 Tax=Streptantibioticus cattleyicolor (strain ATCC 35852 / DSM 46488 / JCM 4925 / NBRC 14057 / NRRL 8057) TaxID=1003195 RepID=F8JRX0_STREN|nr:MULTISPECIES: hypothetical protein [Streptomycetaceae]AEW92880.1 hypothetical protein SCATT_05090 [Streptantibioticus cattleyicolor NRRL 8057 = DSM 46488]CCB73237.1 protein of unknown function [Streptantibioticus cattleyicolor NRRL 8057 = DSM 46488]
MVVDGYDQYAHAQISDIELYGTALDAAGVESLTGNPVPLTSLS